MRACMIVYYYWPRKAGGAESQCRKLAQNLVRNGLEVSILTARYDATLPRAEKDGGTDIVRLSIFESLIRRSENLAHSESFKDSGDVGEGASKVNRCNRIRSMASVKAAWLIRYINILVFCIAFISYLRKNKNSIDVLHVHTADWISGITAISGRLFNLPVICKGADTPVFPDLKGVPLSQLLDKWRKKNHFVALTRSMANDLMVHGVPEDAISIIPNGVELSDQVVDPLINDTFLFLGNFSQTAAHKGFDILLEAWSMVIEQEPDAHLMMVGGGDSSQWQEFAQRKKLHNTVSFPGYCNNVQELLLKSGCFLLPSRKEGMSNALLEAQSVGLPAIVSDIPGMDEVVINGKTGIIVPTVDSKALSEAILLMLRNPQLRKEYGNAARSRMECLFALDSVTSKIQALYSEVAH